MRILLVNYMEQQTLGGINKNVRMIARYLALNSHEVIVLQANPFNLPGDELYDGFRIIRINYMLVVLCIV